MKAKVGQYLLYKIKVVFGKYHNRFSRFIFYSVFKMATSDSVKSSTKDSVNRNFVRCSPCSDDGRHTAARHYCLNCEMYFCEKCVDCHKYIPSLKSHKVNACDIVDSTTADDETTDQRDVSSTSSEMLKCMKHQDKYIDTFCKNHDNVCCATCGVIEHRSCKTELIAVSSKNFKSSKDFSDSKQRLTSVLNRLNQETEKRTNNLESIGKQKLEHIETVDKYEEKLIAKVKEMANNSRAEIRDKYEKDKSVIEDELVPLNATTNTVSEYVEKLQETDNEPLLFTNTKISSSVAKDGETLLQHMTEGWTEKGTVFYFDTSLKTDKTSLGRLEGLDVATEYKSTFQMNVNTVRNDKKDTCIIDMCLTDSNELVLANQGNKKLKRYTTDLMFKDELKLSGMPDSVFNIGDENVAVRINDSKTVNIVSVDQSMKITSSLTVAGTGDRMAYDADTGEIYACEGNRLSVYSKTGQQLRTYDKDANGEALFSSSVNIALSEDKQNIYVTDWNKGLIVIDKNGTLKTRVDVPGEGYTFPMCLLPGNICLVGRHAASTMIQLDKDGKLLGNIIDSKDGRMETYCAVYDRKNFRLIVGGKPSIISIYTLSRK